MGGVGSLAGEWVPVGFAHASESKMKRVVMKPERFKGDSSVGNGISTRNYVRCRSQGGGGVITSFNCTGYAKVGKGVFLPELLRFFCAFLSEVESDPTSLVGTECRSCG